MTTLKKMYPCMVSAGYCDLQHILKWYTPAYYNAGVYGWNCDIYTIYNYDRHESLAISSGYRNTRGPMISREIIKEFNTRANDIETRHNGFGAAEYEAKQAEYETLRQAFANAVFSAYFDNKKGGYNYVK